MEIVDNPQELGCYYLLKTIKSLNPDHYKFLIEVIKRQHGLFLVYLEEMEKIYSKCLDKDGEVISMPDRNKIDIWRNKIHNFCEESLKEILNYLELNVCVSKKTRKKRFLKIKESEMDCENQNQENLNEINSFKNSANFYAKHVWKEKCDPEILISKSNQ